MITLRLATDADAARIAALFSDSQRLLTFLPDLHTDEEDRGFIGNVVMRECRVTVAESDGAIIGFMAEQPGWIDHLYIDPKVLRSGAGTLLLRDTLSRQDQLDLWCFADNARARAVYEKHGFVAAEFADGSGNEAKCRDIRYRWTKPTA